MIFTKKVALKYDYLHNSHQPVNSVIQIKPQLEAAYI